MDRMPNPFSKILKAGAAALVLGAAVPDTAVGAERSAIIERVGGPTRMNLEFYMRDKFELKFLNWFNTVGIHDPTIAALTDTARMLETGEVGLEDMRTPPRKSAFTKNILEPRPLPKELRILDSVDETFEISVSRMRAADPTRKQITLRDNEVFLIVRIHVPDNEMTDQKYFDAGFFGPAFGDLMGFELVYNVDTRSAILLPY